MRSGVFVDSNVLLHHLAGDPKAKKIIDSVEDGIFDGYVNQIVISEVIFVYMKPEIIKRANLSKVYELLSLFNELCSHRDITILAKEVLHNYGLLPNDSLIAATCKHYGIKKIATFDEVFERVDFLEVMKL